jgi:hypothetical protein
MTSNSEKQPQYTDMPPMELVENVCVAIKDNHLLIDIDLTHHGKVTGTGKSINVAGPLGWGVEVPGTDVTLALQVRKPNPEHK